MIRITATGYTYDLHHDTDSAEVGDYFVEVYECLPFSGYLIESTLDDLKQAARLAREDGYRPDDTCTLVVDDTEGDGRTEDFPFSL